MIIGINHYHKSQVTDAIKTITIQTNTITIPLHDQNGTIPD
jgi:hypothetical protein